MRILFSFAGGHGHFMPLAPVARAALAAGHQVAFACQKEMVRPLGQAGFSAFDTGGNTTNTERKPLLPVDMNREERVVRRAYAGRVAHERAGELIALGGQWRPDVLVCDEMDFGALVAAERLGVPACVVLVIAAEAFVRPDALAEPLGMLRSAYGLDAAHAPDFLHGRLALSPFPRGLRDPAGGVPVLRFRPGGFEPASDDGWRLGLPPGKVVHATLGTVFNLESGDLFARLLTGLGGLPANLVMTVGAGIDPAEFAPLPETVRIYSYVPAAALLPHCDLVVSQGGSGIVTATLAHGLPAVLLPMGADQPLTAARCAALGVARVLDPVAATPEAIAAAALEMLHDPAPRLEAGRIAAEMAAFPDAAAALARIVALPKA